MKVLAMDTSSSVATVAIVSDDKVEGEIYLNHKMQHSVILFPMIEKLLKITENSLQDIDIIAVSGGPGSFTGLRIGVAAAKGMVQGSNKTFITVSSLEAMAYQQSCFDGVICPIMDALRDNVYTAVYEFKDGELINTMPIDALHIDELLDKLEAYSKILFCGDAVSIHIGRIKDRLKDKALFSTQNNMLPRASSIGEIALKKYSKGEISDIYTFSPLYIRKSQAEREYEKRTGEKIE
ncbi:tRNA (adenosine(37)-N6)-threonylcarbamoyltransferase complex dimerization subunit type 1 TsaB [Caloramator proteoclasticus]|uniref:tRNA threonylcarbamoyl adenosine modification protein YeaZ n=1 Tax=Caloramator proteoclasticus DSM 10124 TaxID=1121262 RepID=A0A1M4VKI3_9CLOT|nr:tRNA (adenosine(37)-N6)-threonylcarbamoyltransferase complex dimerization subunit type 1 TsaB [Caloramator proteoclasticus]SHE69566.1 tRNA threonylcarbamoyl adenosine modification protein YeaZ [Caloramator proteoclasticus DSM 10124]